MLYTLMQQLYTTWHRLMTYALSLPVEHKPRPPFLHCTFLRLPLSFFPAVSEAFHLFLSPFHVFFDLAVFLCCLLMSTVGHVWQQCHYFVLVYLQASNTSFFSLVHICLLVSFLPQLIFFFSGHCLSVIC